MADSNLHNFRDVTCKSRIVLWEDMSLLAMAVFMLETLKSS